MHIKQNERMKTMRESTVVGIYARVALNEHNELEKQVKKLCDAAEKDGYSDFKIYSEVCSGLDATREGRRELYNIFDDVSEGVLNRLYVNDYSRFSRDMLFCNNVSDKLLSQQCEIISLENRNDEEVDPTHYFIHMCLGNAEPNDVAAKKTKGKKLKLRICNFIKKIIK